MGGPCGYGPEARPKPVTEQPPAAAHRDSAAARRLTSLWGVSFGEAALAAFVLCAVSGVLLLPAFDARDGVRSIGQWLLANPGAVVLRNLHYWTAQAFLVLTVLHAWDHLRRGREQRLPRGVWLRLVASLPVLAFLMLSGFLLRGDADAQQAQRILEEMLDRLPLAGPLLAQFLLGSDSGSPQVVFVQHAATATVIVWLVVVEHARRLWGSLRAWVLITAVCGALALLVSMTPAKVVMMERSTRGTMSAWQTPWPQVRAASAMLPGTSTMPWWARAASSVKGSPAWQEAQPTASGLCAGLKPVMPAWHDRQPSGRPITRGSATFAVSTVTRSSAGPARRSPGPAGQAGARLQ